MRRLIEEIDRQSDVAHSATEKNRPGRAFREPGAGLESGAMSVIDL